jgi:hypothetical protein
LTARGEEKVADDALGRERGLGCVVGIGIGDAFAPGVRPWDSMRSSRASLHVHVVVLIENGFTKGKADDQLINAIDRTDEVLLRRSQNGPQFMSTGGMSRRRPSTISRSEVSCSWSSTERWRKINNCSSS